MAYSFTATAASRGYDVYKNTSWTNVKVGEKVTVVMECLYRFVKRLYDWNYTGLVQDNNDDDEED